MDVYRLLAPGFTFIQEADLYAVSTIARAFIQHHDYLYMSISSDVLFRYRFHRSHSSVNLSVEHCAVEQVDPVTFNHVFGPNLNIRVYILFFIKIIESLYRLNKSSLGE